MLKNGFIEETEPANIVAAISEIGLYEEFILEGGWNPFITTPLWRWVKVANSIEELQTTWSNDQRIIIQGIDTSNIVAFLVTASQYNYLKNTPGDWKTLVYPLTDEGKLYYHSTRISYGNYVTVEFEGEPKLITRYLQPTQSIITTRRFDRWWRKAQAWFDTKFASIHVDLTPVEEKLDDIEEAVENIHVDSESADQLASFFNITEATEYQALTPAEAIAIARDCQYNVMGTDWPIPTWLPTGVTEAQVESAAEGLGIPYHEPTQTA